MHEHIHLKASENSYDWLGHGIYFWEGNPARALQFATECMAGNGKSKGSIKEPFVLGAIINLGHCLNLADIVAIEEIKASYAGRIFPSPYFGIQLKPHQWPSFLWNK